MHLGRNILFYVVTGLSGSFAFSATTKLPTDEDVRREYQDNGVVLEKESTYFADFRDRRRSWTTYLSVGWSQYSPSDYVPDFVANKTLDTYYESAESPMTEITVSVKRNFSFGAIYMDIGGGGYRNNGPDGAQLSVMMARLGFGVILDTLFREPFLAPYGFLGGFVSQYKESLPAQSLNGNTGIGTYFGAGVRIQLDSLDDDGDRLSYVDHGLENTFLYAEVRSLINNDPNVDLGSGKPLELGAGITFEF